MTPWKLPACALPSHLCTCHSGPLLSPWQQPNLKESPEHRTKHFSITPWPVPYRATPSRKPWTAGPPASRAEGRRKRSMAKPVSPACPVQKPEAEFTHPQALSDPYHSLDTTVSNHSSHRAKWVLNFQPGFREGIPWGGRNFSYETAIQPP
jgi:hypothetical protein